MLEFFLNLNRCCFAPSLLIGKWPLAQGDARGLACPGLRNIGPLGMKNAEDRVQVSARNVEFRLFRPASCNFVRYAALSSFSMGPGGRMPPLHGRRDARRYNGVRFRPVSVGWGARTITTGLYAALACKNLLSHGGGGWFNTVSKF